MAAGGIVVAILVQILLCNVHAAGLNAFSGHLREKSGKASSSAARKSSSFAKKSASKGFFDSPPEHPTMLLISSPMERKVSYTMLKNFKSVGDVVLPILDAGLVSPYGLAWDAPRSALYICDAQKILRVKLKSFRCVSQCKGVEHQLKIEGNIVSLVEGVTAQWASVDKNGNLFFTDQQTKSVVKMPVEVIDRIIKEEITSKDLRWLTEPEVAGEEAAKAAMADHGTTQKPNTVYQLYEKGVSPNVGTPAGIVVHNSELYWTNQVGGFTQGAVVEGKTKPEVKKIAEETDAPTFPSGRLANNTGSAFGVAATRHNFVIYADTSHTVWSCSRVTRETVALSQDFLKPRGIAYDGMNTVFVADQGSNSVSSVPVGVLRGNAPVTHTVDIHSPFGLALVSSHDLVWESEDSSASSTQSEQSWLGSWLR